MRRFQMRNRVLALFPVVTLVTMIVLCTSVLIAQAPSGTKSFDPTATDPEKSVNAAAERAKAEAAAVNWTPPRTAWGDPDVQGYWSSDVCSSDQIGRAHV